MVWCIGRLIQYITSDDFLTTQRKRLNKKCSYLSFCVGVGLERAWPCEHLRFSVYFSQNNVSQLICAKQSLWFKKCLATKGEGMNIYFTSSFICFNQPPFIDHLQYTKHSVRCLRLNKPWALCWGLPRLIEHRRGRKLVMATSPFPSGQWQYSAINNYIHCMSFSF